MLHDRYPLALDAVRRRAATFGIWPQFAPAERVGYSSAACVWVGQSIECNSCIFYSVQKIETRKALHCAARLLTRTMTLGSVLHWALSLIFAVLVSWIPSKSVALPLLGDITRSSDTSQPRRQYACVSGGIWLRLSVGFRWHARLIAGSVRVFRARFSL